MSNLIDFNKVANEWLKNITQYPEFGDFLHYYIKQRENFIHTYEWLVELKK